MFVGLAMGFVSPVSTGCADATAASHDEPSYASHVPSDVSRKSTAAPAGIESAVEGGGMGTDDVVLVGEVLVVVLVGVVEAGNVVGIDGTLVVVDETDVVVLVEGVLVGVVVVGVVVVGVVVGVVVVGVVGVVETGGALVTLKGASEVTTGS